MELNMTDAKVKSSLIRRRLWVEGKSCRVYYETDTKIRDFISYFSPSQVDEIMWIIRLDACSEKLQFKNQGELQLKQERL